MQTVLSFQATIKNSSGKGIARAVRREGMIPAIVYGLGKQYMLSIGQKEFYKEYVKGGILSKLISLKTEDGIINAITREVQIDPVSDQPIHIDFQQIDENKPIKLAVHIKVKNENKCIGMKKGGILNIVQRSAKFLCMPDQIKSFIEIDISDLQIGQSIHINDVKLPNNMVACDKTNFPILSISGRARETEEEENVVD